MHYSSRSTQAVADAAVALDAVRRIAGVAGRHPLYVPAPLWAIRLLARITEATMIVPLVAKAQAVMLGEGVSEPAPWTPEAPEGIRPALPFSEERIRAALPTAGRFGWRDLLVSRRSRRNSHAAGPMAPSTP